MQNRADAPFPKHFDGKRFFNPGSPQVRGYFDVLRWKLTSLPESSPRFIDDVKSSKPPSQVDGAELRVTLVNHSTVLLQQNGLNILTDPIWSKRASPLQWIGPRRHRIPGVRFDDLPRIDIVLLSHNHYDHLDLTTLRLLARPAACQFVAPIGLARWLESEGIRPVRELDWDESFAEAGATIHCVPALHFSSRTPFDRNRTLWCGFIIEIRGDLLYFAGDTAFGDHFAQIRAQFGAPRLALLPIGAYQPRWFMFSVHMSPEQAIRAHEILGPKTSIAIHHGTFQLTDESLETPRHTLIESGLPASFLVLANGESASLP